jgi:hypothetical protein
MMTLSSLRICLGIFLMVDIQAPIWAGVGNVESGESARMTLRMFLRDSQDPPNATLPSPEAPPPAPQDRSLLLRARDENGAPVASAKVYLFATSAEGQRLVAVWETDSLGRVPMAGIAPGVYQLRVEKQGFYAIKMEGVEVGKAETLDINLEHEQEIRESVDVSSAPPTIDQTRTVASDEIGAREIVNLPYPRRRDFKNMVAYLPRVHQDNTGQLHLNGAASYQTFYALDGFNITHPASGLLEVRVSPDALRKIEIQSSRFSAEYGKASGGVLNLTTGMGDDRYRVAATDFAPSAQFINGIHLDSWTPRLMFSGPIRKGRAWFYSAADADVSFDIQRDLPDGANKNLSRRVGELVKGQVNLSPTHLVSMGMLINQFHNEYSGLSVNIPQQSAPELKQDAYLFTLKDQVFRANGLSFETGLALSKFSADILPHGALPYQLTPKEVRGSYFMRSEASSQRIQGLVNLTLSPSEWRGRHEVKLGADINHVKYARLLDRRPIQILRADNTISRVITFDSNRQARRDNIEAGLYLQDRWAISNRLLVETGMRFDRDNIVRRVLASPRLAGSALLTKDGDTRLSLGAGLFYDATNLDIVTRTLEGRRQEQFVARDGLTVFSDRSAVTTFTLNDRRLEAPRYFGLSMEFERKLPADIYFRSEYLGRWGVNGYAFNVQGGDQTGQQLMTVLDLRNSRRDRYDAFSVTTRRAFRENYLFFASYTRSSARTNSVLDFSLDTPLFSPQSGGPFSWDAPNRLLSWGWAPVPFVKKTDIAYSVEWRSGYPFSVIDQDRRLSGEPNSNRFPNYFSLNVHAERKLRLLSFNLALRAGFNNITDRQNAVAVDNNINSDNFLNFNGIQGRQFTARIRFLGRK